MKIEKNPQGPTKLLWENCKEGEVYTTAGAFYIKTIGGGYVNLQTGYSSNNPPSRECTWTHVPNAKLVV